MTGGAHIENTRVSRTRISTISRHDIIKSKGDNFILTITFEPAKERLNNIGLDAMLIHKDDVDISQFLFEMF
jgi:hypothetical protein